MVFGEIRQPHTPDDLGDGYVLPGQGMDKVPTTLVSIEKMRPDVPAAISLLRRRDAFDLIEMLGLDEFVEKV